jgi:hypothetical protein
MIRKIKHWFRKQSMILVKKNNKRQLHAHNLQSAKKVAVIMCYQFDVENNALVRLRSIAESYQLEVTLLIYYPQSTLPENIQNTADKIVFSDKECNWFGKPIAKHLSKFTNEPFDLLLNLSTQDLFPMEYITARRGIYRLFGTISFQILNRKVDHYGGVDT